jgi:uncharacterized protein
MDVPITRRHILFYEYGGENVAERRAPHREAHIRLVREWMADGRLLLGGAVGDPPHGGVLVFASDNPADAQQFAEADPYVANDVVTAWRIEPWNVVS